MAFLALVEFFFGILPRDVTGYACFLSLSNNPYVARHPTSRHPVCRTPFTIQRLCELLVEPRRMYNSTKRFMNAVFKMVTVSIGAWPFVILCQSATCLWVALVAAASMAPCPAVFFFFFFFLGLFCRNKLWSPLRSIAVTPGGDPLVLEELAPYAENVQPSAGNVLNASDEGEANAVFKVPPFLFFLKFTYIFAIEWDMQHSVRAQPHAFL